MVSKVWVSSRLRTEALSHDVHCGSVAMFGPVLRVQHAWVQPQPAAAQAQQTQAQQLVHLCHIVEERRRRRSADRMVTMADAKQLRSDGEAQRYAEWKATLVIYSRVNTEILTNKCGPAGPGAEGSCRERGDRNMIRRRPGREVLPCGSLLSGVVWGLLNFSPCPEYQRNCHRQRSESIASHASGQGGAPRRHHRSGRRLSTWRPQSRPSERLPSM